MTKRPLAFRNVLPPAPEPVAFEQVVYAADRHAGLAHLISNHLSATDETDAHQAATLLADALERQATLLRAFMETSDDAALLAAAAEAPIGGPMAALDVEAEEPE